MYNNYVEGAKGVEARRVQVKPKRPEREMGLPMEEQVETKYRIHDALDEVDMLLNELVHRMTRLQNVLDSVLEQTPTCERTNLGPRVSNSPMMGRINNHLDILTELNIHAEELIGKVHL